PAAAAPMSQSARRLNSRFLFHLRNELLPVEHGVLDWPPFDLLESIGVDLPEMRTSRDVEALPAGSHRESPRAGVESGQDHPIKGKQSRIKTVEGQSLFRLDDEVDRTVAADGHCANDRQGMHCTQGAPAESDPGSLGC